MSTILSILSDAADDLSIHRPPTLFGAYNEGDAGDRKLVRALTRACRYMSASYDWSVLKRRHAWAATATEEQPSLPTDFERVIMGTAWDDDLRRELCGPLSDQEWAEAKSSAIGRIEPAYVIYGKTLLMQPVPEAGRQFSLMYISNAIGRDAEGGLIERFSADSDTPLWGDELVTLGTIWQYRKAERYDYAQDELDFKLLMQDRIKRDGGGKALDMGGPVKSSADMVARLKSAVFFIGDGS